MTCPNPDCGKETGGKQVVRTVKLAKEIIRERRCAHCGWTWITIEKIEAVATSSTE